MADGFDESLNSLVSKFITTLTSLQSGISDLYLKKTGLINDIKKLRYQRELLLAQKPKIQSEYQSLALSQNQESVDFAKGVGAKLAEESKRIVKEGDRLTSEALFLSEMADYYTELSLILDKNDETNTVRAVELAEKEAKMVKDRSLLEQIFEKTADSFEKARLKNEQAQKLRDEAAKLKESLEHKVKSEQKRLERWEKELNFVKKETNAKERHFKEIEERLSEWERGLKDKDRALVRRARELKML